MKLLIIGIDGGTKRIFEAFDMPFVHNLLKDGVSRRMNEDLFSRGWAEIVNGKTAEHTRAFYMAPKMDGSHAFSISYNTSESEKYGCLPIWRVAENAGSSVGIMNVPTTSPACVVDGFMVGSGGGGLNKVIGLPDSLVYPKEVKQFLEDNEYVVDIRITTSGIEEIEELFEKLINKERVRAKLYVDLCQKYDIDFGFLVDRATTIVQYLCMSEIETYIAMKSMPEVSGRTQDKDPSSSKIFELLEGFYRELDNNIRLVYESLNAENFLLTADHSTVPYKLKGNMSAFLEEEGFLVRPHGAKKTAVQVMKKWIRVSLPSAYTSKIKRKIPQDLVSLVDGVDWSRTRAFGHDYIDGIYVNDSRFKGPVKDGDVTELVSSIAGAFNSHPVAKDYGLYLEPYRSKHSQARFKDHLPDLILNKTDELHIVNRGAFIYHNPNYGPIPEIKEIRDDMFTGQKGRDPIFLMNTNLAKLVNEGDPNNLTLAYKLTERVFDSRMQEVYN